MAVTMALFWISLVLTIVGLNASGELSILHSPDSLRFSGSAKASESTLKEIFSAALGLSVEENSEWNGLLITDPFNTPEAVVEVYIDGVSTLSNAAGLKSKNFPLIVDEYEPNTYNQMKHRIMQRFNNGGNKLVNIMLSNAKELKYSDVFGKMKELKVHKQSLLHLKTSVEEDAKFLTELEALRTITEKVMSGAITADNIIDFYNFRFRSLHALSDYHGPNSLQTKEAKKLLGEALEALTAAFVKAYDGSVLVTAVTTDIAHTRRVVRSTDTRQNPEDPEGEPAPPNPEDPEGKPAPPNPEDPEGEPAPPNPGSDHSDDGYSADYAAIFNIILWFGVVFAFSLVAIVYALVDMDPGRDSIIYRMTSTRMKKDN